MTGARAWVEVNAARGRWRGRAANGKMRVPLNLVTGRFSLSVCTDTFRLQVMKVLFRFAVTASIIAMISLCALAQVGPGGALSPREQYGEGERKLFRHRAPSEDASSITAWRGPFILGKRCCRIIIQ